MTCNDRITIRLNLVNLTKGRKDRSKLGASSCEGTGCFFQFLTHGITRAQPKRMRQRVLCPLSLIQPAKPQPVSLRQYTNANAMSNYYCEYCGQKFSSVRALAALRCGRHPLGPVKGNHKLYEGAEAHKYLCEYCGQEFSSISALTGLRCTRHPTDPRNGRHKPFAGGVKSRYTCKYCGSSSGNLKSLTGLKCPKHPLGTCKGYHSPVQ